MSENRKYLFTRNQQNQNLPELLRSRLLVRRPPYSTNRHRISVTTLERYGSRTLPQQLKRNNEQAANHNWRSRHYDLIKSLSRDRQVLENSTFEPGIQSTSTGGTNQPKNITFIELASYENDRRPRFKPASKNMVMIELGSYENDRRPIRELTKNCTVELGINRNQRGPFDTTQRSENLKGHGRILTPDLSNELENKTCLHASNNQSDPTKCPDCLREVFDDYNFSRLENFKGRQTFTAEQFQERDSDHDIKVKNENPEVIRILETKSCPHGTENPVKRRNCLEDLCKDLKKCTQNIYERNSVKSSHYLTRPADHLTDRRNSGELPYQSTAVSNLNRYQQTRSRNDNEKYLGYLTDQNYGFRNQTRSQNHHTISKNMNKLPNQLLDSRYLMSSSQQPDAPNAFERADHQTHPSNSNRFNHIDPRNQRKLLNLNQMQQLDPRNINRQPFRQADQRNLTIHSRNLNTPLPQRSYPTNQKNDLKDRIKMPRHQTDLNNLLKLLHEQRQPNAATENKVRNLKDREAQLKNLTRLLNEKPKRKAVSPEALKDSRKRTKVLNQKSMTSLSENLRYRTRLSENAEPIGFSSRRQPKIDQKDTLQNIPSEYSFIKSLQKGDYPKNFEFESSRSDSNLYRPSRKSTSLNRSPKSIDQNEINTQASNELYNLRSLDRLGKSEQELNTENRSAKEEYPSSFMNRSQVSVHSNHSERSICLRTSHELLSKESGSLQSSASRRLSIVKATTAKKSTTDKNMNERIPQSSGPKMRPRGFSLGRPRNDFKSNSLKIGIQSKFKNLYPVAKGFDPNTAVELSGSDSNFEESNEISDPDGSRTLPKSSNKIQGKPDSISVKNVSAKKRTEKDYDSKIRLNSKYSPTSPQKISRQFTKKDSMPSNRLEKDVNLDNISETLGSSKSLEDSRQKMNSKELPKYKVSKIEDNTGPKEISVVKRKSWVESIDPAAGPSTSKWSKLPDRLQDTNSKISGSKGLLKIAGQSNSRRPTDPLSKPIPEDKESGISYPLQRTASQRTAGLNILSRTTDPLDKTIPKDPLRRTENDTKSKISKSQKYSSDPRTKKPSKALHRLQKDKKEPSAGDIDHSQFTSRESKVQPGRNIDSNELKNESVGLENKLDSNDSKVSSAPEAETTEPSKSKWFSFGKPRNDPNKENSEELKLVTNESGQMQQQQKKHLLAILPENTESNMLKDFPVDPAQRRIYQKATLGTVQSKSIIFYPLSKGSNSNTSQIVDLSKDLPEAKPERIDQSHNEDLELLGGKVDAPKSILKVEPKLLDSLQQQSTSKMSSKTLLLKTKSSDSPNEMPELQLKNNVKLVGGLVASDLDKTEDLKSNASSPSKSKPASTPTFWRKLFKSKTSDPSPDGVDLESKESSGKLQISEPKEKSWEKSQKDDPGQRSIERPSKSSQKDEASKKAQEVNPYQTLKEKSSKKPQKEDPDKPLHEKSSKKSEIGDSDLTSNEKSSKKSQKDDPDQTSKELPKMKSSKEASKDSESLVKPENLNQRKISKQRLDSNNEVSNYSPESAFHKKNSFEGRSLDPQQTTNNLIESGPIVLDVYPKRVPDDSEYKERPRPGNTI